MKILFDHGTPAPLRNHLREHSVDRSAEKGWELLENGELIRKAEEEGYKVIVTTDQSTYGTSRISPDGGWRLSCCYPPHGPECEIGRKKSETLRSRPDRRIDEVRDADSIDQINPADVESPS